MGTTKTNCEVIASSQVGLYHRILKVQSWSIGKENIKKISVTNSLQQKQMMPNKIITIDLMQVLMLD